MNDTELQRAIRALALPPREQNTALALARRPNAFFLIIAAIFTLTGIVELRIGWEGLAFAHNRPPADAPPIAALHAFARARQVESFYQGTAALLVAVCHLLLHYSASRQHRLMLALVSRASQSNL